MNGMNGNSTIMKGSSSFTCALTGEREISDPVVTPSGYVCSRKYLLNALLESKGKDPFVISSEVDLDESQLVDLKQSGAAAPLTIPTTSGSSVSSLLTQLQNEYHGVLMELFSTKRKLQQTKQELSTALYQNDAAVRVIARLAMERDEARSQLQQQLANVPSAAPPSKKRARVEDDDSNKMTEEKKLDDSHIESLVQTWQHLSAGRKAMKKATAIVDYTTLVPDAENNKDCDQLIAAGKGQFWALLSSANNTINIQPSNVTIKLVESSSLKSIHMMEFKPEAENDVTWMIATITVDGQLQVYTNDRTDGQISSSSKLSDDIIGIQIHPGGQYLLLTSRDGNVTILKSSTAETLSSFSVVAEASSDISCAQLHPDGLIHAMGTKDGKVLLWDVKSQALASTLEIPQKNATITSIVFSENGYHLFTCTDENQCILWDLRKQKILQVVDNVTLASFDTSGKYTALVQDKCISIQSVKEFSNSHKLECNSCSSMVWTKDANQPFITTSQSDGKKSAATTWKSEKN